MKSNTEIRYLRENCKLEIRNFNKMVKLWENDLYNNNIDIGKYLFNVHAEIEKLNKKIYNLRKSIIPF